MSSTILNNVSPYENFYNKQPSLAYLKVLGCLCHVKIVHEQDKLMSRTKKDVHMGYSKTKKGFSQIKVFLFIRRSLSEKTFPFKDTEHTQSQLFPSYV